MSDTLNKREIIFELHQVGTIVRVMAMDVQTQTEVVLQGPASAGEMVLKKNALQKLEYVLRKRGIIG